MSDEPAPRSRLLALRTNRGFLLAIAWVSTVVVLAVVAPLVARDSPATQDLVHTFAGPSGRHWLGTDDLGRDVATRLLYGARISMQVTFEVVGLALIVAIPIGLAAGYRGGAVDNVLMRVMDAGLSFPPLVLALAVVGVLGPSVGNAAIALAIVFVPSFARLIRGQTLAIREEHFIEASHVGGSPASFIVRRRIFPNVLSALIVMVALALGGALLAEAGLSFLGLGAQPPAASWGSMLREAYDTALFTHPWALVWPGAAIAITVYAFNVIGDGLGSALGNNHASGGKRRPRQRRSFGLTDVAVRPPVGAHPAPVAGALLEVRDLTVTIGDGAEETSVVDDLSFVVRPGEMLGLVGESGSGKTVTSLAIMRLLASPPFAITSGSVLFGGEDLLALEFDGMRTRRGNDIAMVFQDPMAALNPTRTVGAQLVEAIRLHEKVTRSAARRRSVELLDRVGIPDAEARLRSYPHQLSGGMRQRAMIAMALSCRPRLLIADEPTTALDVTIQAQVLTLLKDIVASEEMSVLLVTHDLGVVAETCDNVAVMYAGQIVEYASTSELFHHPRHPYTAGLIHASLVLEGEDAPELVGIEGNVPLPGHLPSGCRFHPRCAHAVPACAADAPALTGFEDRLSRCIRQDELVVWRAS